MWRIFTSEMGTLKVSLRRPVPLAQPTGSPFLLSICSHLVYFNGDFTFTYVNSALYLSSSWQESLSRMWMTSSGSFLLCIIFPFSANFSLDCQGLSLLHFYSSSMMCKGVLCKCFWFSFFNFFLILTRVVEWKNDHWNINKSCWKKEWMTIEILTRVVEWKNE